MFLFHARTRRPAEPSAPRDRSGLLRGRRGAVLVWGAFLMVPLLAFVGLGVDTGRAYLVRARLAQSLDSAALTAGRNTTDQAAAQAEAQMIFKANFPPGFMDATVSGPTIVFDSTAETVTISASAVLPTYFLQLIGQKTFTVSASSEVSRKTVYMDVVISIDVSGSMNEYVGGTKKIDAARGAANTLIDALYGAAVTKDLLKVGFVTWNSNVRILPVGYTYNRSEATSKTVTTFKNPYSTGTNVSTVWMAKGSPVPLLSRPAAGWTGCAHARYIDPLDTNDADATLGTANVGNRAWFAWKPAFLNYNNVTMQCSATGFVRLTNTKTAVVSAINQVTSGGDNTNLPQGLMWAWRMLGTTGSPFAGDGTPAPAPSEGQLMRAIVFMTDGENYVSTGDAYEGRLTKAQLDDRVKLIAQRAKDAGIIIYAVQFAENNSAQIALMKLIASGPTAPYYQYAPDSATLKAAFQEIGNHLSKLRLSK